MPVPVESVAKRIARGCAWHAIAVRPAEIAASAWVRTAAKRKPDSTGCHAANCRPKRNTRHNDYT